MDRTHIVVIGVVLAALALFGLKLRADRDSLRDAVLSGGQVESGEDVPAGDSGSGAGGRLAAQPGSPGRGESGRPEGRGSKAGGAGPGGLERGRGPGAAAVVGGLSARGKGAEAGAAVGGRSRDGLPGRLASLGAAGEVPEKPRPGSRSEELVEFLSTRDPTSPQALADPAETEGDVVLEINSVADSADAVENHKVEEASDGVGIQLGEDSVLSFPNGGNANANAGTITFDVDPEWTGSDRTDNSFVQLRAPNQWDNRMQLVKNGRYLRFILTDDTSREADISVPIDHWEPGRPHTVTATWGDGKTQLYIDGRRVGQNTYQGQFTIPPNTPMYVGSDLPDGSYAGAAATIQNFKVYRRALPEEEVAIR